MKREGRKHMRNEQIHVTNDVKDLKCTRGIAFAMSQESKPTTKIYNFDSNIQSRSQGVHITSHEISRENKRFTAHVFSGGSQGATTTYYLLNAKSTKNN